MRLRLDGSWSISFPTGLYTVRSTLTSGSPSLAEPHSRRRWSTHAEAEIGDITELAGYWTAHPRKKLPGKERTDRNVVRTCPPRPHQLIAPGSLIGKCVSGKANFPPNSQTSFTLTDRRLVQSYIHHHRNPLKGSEPEWSWWFVVEPRRELNTHPGSGGFGDRAMSTSRCDQIS